MSTLGNLIFETKEINQHIPTSNDLSDLRSNTKLIALDKLQNNSLNRDINQDKVLEYVNSIRLSGIIQDPVVMPNDDGTFTILSGHHRIAACKILCKENKDFSAIRCKVKKVDAFDAELILIDSNLENNPLSPYEKMMAIGRKEELLKAKKTKGTLRDIIALDSSLKATQVGTYLKVYKKCISEVKQALKEKTITLDQAAELSKADPDAQRELLLSPTNKNVKDKQVELDVPCSKEMQNEKELYKLLDKSFKALSNLDDFINDCDDEFKTDEMVAALAYSTAAKRNLRAILSKVSDNISNM